MHYVGDITLAFNSVIHIIFDVNYGWLFRLIHATGASFFFFFMYLHIGRGLYYGSFNKKILWNLGVIIYFILIGTAFLGYVLPWGQISYWAATVITNLISTIPFFGSKIVIWLWGGFSVSNPTLTRFYSLHFVLPFVVTFLVVLHIYYLHIYTRSNPLGVDSSSNKITFHYYFIIKDFILFILVFFIFILFRCIFGYSFIDPENFIPANSIVTPIHIQPEWYFLFAYAILRSIPNKLGGVIFILLRILILILYSFNTKSLLTENNKFTRLIFWNLVVRFLLLTWLGASPAEAPYIFVSQIITILYFTFHFILIFINFFLNKEFK